ncbi:MAG TPA: Crp/Fnr family transcriptional regulator [Niabella sp.]
MFEPFRNKFPLSQQQWSEYTGCFKRIQVPAKTTLLKEGDISKKMFLIEKGCIRVWYNHNGKDITTQFFFENNMVASIESFIKKIPSPVSIETIEPSVLWWIHKKDADRIIEAIKEIPPLRDLYINTIFERTFDYMKHFFSFIKDTPGERYLHLLNEKPQIVQRVPQHYIASYLGITKVHLSRIKRTLAKKR